MNFHNMFVANRVKCDSKLRMFLPVVYNGSVHMLIALKQFTNCKSRNKVVANLNYSTVSLWRCIHVYVQCVLCFVGVCFVTYLKRFIILRSVINSRCGPRRTTLWSRSGRWCWTGTPTTTSLRWNRSPSPQLTSSRGWRPVQTRCYRY